VSKRAQVQIQRYGRYFAALVALMVIGTACGVFILQGQRLQSPFASSYSLSAAFPSATAVVGGLGEPVNVAGVRVGQITGTSLQDGQAIVHMSIDPSKLPRLYRDAHAQLVPNTPLKDMQVDIAPGNASAGTLAQGATIPASETLTPIDSDELLDSLDTDTRTWLAGLLTSVGQATAGRGQDIQQLLRSLGPTASQLHQLGDLLVARKRQISELVHNFGTLTKAASTKDAQLGTLVQAGDRTIHALAVQDTALRQSITQLPGTLQSARTTLSDVIPLAHALGPAARALEPTARKLPTTLSNTNTLLQGAALLPVKQIQPFVHASLPVARLLPGLATDLRSEIPELIDSFKVLVYATNELAYNPGGGNPGFLYWLAWFAHNSASFISTGDANGPVWRAVIVSSCKSLDDLPSGAILEKVLGTDFNCGPSSALSALTKGGPR
jgi:phospholipid/cholesterol/gamma-HCH transport system substrate-binding protein